MPSEHIRGSHLGVVILTAYGGDLLASLLANDHVGRNAVSDIHYPAWRVALSIEEIPAPVLIYQVGSLFEVLRQYLIKALLVGLSGGRVELYIPLGYLGDLLQPLYVAVVQGLLPVFLGGLCVQNSLNVGLGDLLAVFGLYGGEVDAMLLGESLGSLRSLGGNLLVVLFELFYGLLCLGVLF